FLLRIEDTDLARSETRFTEDIMESLKWLGLNWDEEPVYQSKRFSRYTELADQLLAKNLAFRCDCSPETLNALREKCEKDKKPFRYPGTCRDKKTVNSPHVIRVKTPSDGETAFTDLIR
ncbi:glutamate--tRNA ligase, partial [Candidatus Shapirobacteria bacterium CG10_big_fil_rev_8_21_14_0_10_36_6]